MSVYLIHKDFSGVPIGVWNESGKSYYPRPHALQKSASNLLSNRVGEPWKEYVERIASRVSHRDWWELHTSKHTELDKVWQEAVPGYAPLFENER